MAPAHSRPAFLAADGSNEQAGAYLLWIRLETTA
jgi:hypothetical protein